MILVEQKTLVSILNGTKLIGGLVTLVRAVTRLFNSESGKMIREELERLQSLTKQSLAGGKVNLTEKEMNKIRKDTKIILNKTANELGYNNWDELKTVKIKEINDRFKKL
jgi:uncharacterized membrane protein